MIQCFILFEIYFITSLDSILSIFPCSPKQKAYFDDTVPLFMYFLYILSTLISYRKLTIYYVNNNGSSTTEEDSDYETDEGR